MTFDAELTASPKLDPTLGIVSPEDFVVTAEMVAVVRNNRLVFPSVVGAIADNVARDRGLDDRQRLEVMRSVRDDLIEALGHRAVA